MDYFARRGRRLKHCSPSVSGVLLVGACGMHLPRRQSPTSLSVRDGLAFSGRAGPQTRRRWCFCECFGLWKRSSLRDFDSEGCADAVVLPTCVGLVQLEVGCPCAGCCTWSKASHRWFSPPYFQLKRTCDGMEGGGDGVRWWEVGGGVRGARCSAGCAAAANRVVAGR